MSFKLERTYKEVGTIKKDGPNLIHLVDKYSGATDALSSLKVRDDMGSHSWNTSLPVPLQAGEAALVHPMQDDVPNGYVRVIHSEHRAVSVFSLNHFEKTN